MTDMAGETILQKLLAATPSDDKKVCRLTNTKYPNCRWHCDQEKGEEFLTRYFGETDKGDRNDWPNTKKLVIRGLYRTKSMRTSYL